MFARCIAIKRSRPSFTRGVYAYDFCDTRKICPLAIMYPLRSSFMPNPIHAGGLRYHGMSPILSELYDQKMMRAIAVEQTEVFKAAQMFARVDIICPAIKAAPKSQ